jgi:capsular exopolysaccharide synthesis family protein
MDGIQPYAGVHHPAYPAHPAAAPHHPAVAPPFAAHHAPGALPAKTPGDYARAIRRRAWLVVAVGVLVSVAGALVVLRMPAIYRASAEVTIEPPKYDQFLSRMMKAESLIQRSEEEVEKYVPDKIALLHSKAMAEKVLRDPSLSAGQPVGPVEDAAAELAKNLYSRNRTGTHYYTVSLDGRDPAKVAKTLHLLLELFRDAVRVESTDALEQSRRFAGQTLEKLSKDLGSVHSEIYKLTRTSSVIAPGGTNVSKERLAAVNQALVSERSRYGDLQRQLRIESLRPAAGRGDSHSSRIAALEEKREAMARRYSHYKKQIRGGDDPSLWAIYNEVKQIDTELVRLRQSQTESAGTDDFEVILTSARDEIQALEAEQRQLLDEMKDSHPTFDRYYELVAQREMMQKQIMDTQQKLSEFEAMARTQKEPVNIVVPPVEPILPERPKKALYIAVLVVFGFSLGLALAGLLEHVDHSVKVPEHLTSGLSLPLLGVVPRIRRTARVHRGGHLWALGEPDSAAADAYRNVRASLLGVAHTRGPIVTLLVTSAKSGEGKSTTALNLAATCARAGERTLLVDVDLRRPSLADVFPHEQGHLGLVDVLRGEMPWQRVVVPTELPNLDFIPTGDSREVPIEILGSLELRQLLLSLSQHHYDRVILDGPAVLGLADCRMLGRIVDASVLVVRSGRQGLLPLRRAKEMLEQSQVRMAGIVFNGIADDLEDWSSCAPGLTTLGGANPLDPRQTPDWGDRTLPNPSVQS